MPSSGVTNTMSPTPLVRRISRAREDAAALGASAAGAAAAAAAASVADSARSLAAALLPEAGDAEAPAQVQLALHALQTALAPGQDSWRETLQLICEERGASVEGLQQLVREWAQVSAWVRAHGGGTVAHAVRSLVEGAPVHRRPRTAARPLTATYPSLPRRRVPA
ncbi:MAG: hypothetical protein ACK4MU_09235, partial [Thermomonas sp.]